MKIPQVAFVFVFAVFSALPVKAGLVISEVVFNEVGSDVTGEWAEIYNNGGLSIDLSDYKIGDEETSGGAGTGEHMAQFPSGMSINAGQVQIVAVSATRFFTVYGFNPTYEVMSTDPTVPDMTTYAGWDPDGGAINMANTSDHLLLLDGSDVLVDAVNWGNNFSLNPGLTTPVADGQSYFRSNPLIDTDSASDWTLGPGTEVASALRSTPGVVVIPEPSTWAFLVLGIAGLGFGRFRNVLKR